MKNKSNLPMSERYFLWGVLFFLAALASSLAAYYLYSPIGRQFAFSLMVLSLMVLFGSMAKDMEGLFTSKWLIWSLLFILLAIYFSQRTEVHRFDFMVGDASDYFAAGLCSVTYNQDIGYILPLSATITGVGYEVFGIENALMAYVILYATSIPIFYYFFRKLQIPIFISFFMSVFLIFIPLSLWFSKSSFTEPIWQILLFVFAYNMYEVIQKEHLSWKHILMIYIILFLAPMLRVEGVLYYGFILFLALYHLWRYKHILTPLLLTFGLYIVAFSTQLTLKLRPDYLLNRQFNRIIPHATADDVMFALYGLATIFVLLVILFYFIRKLYARLPFVQIVVILTVIIKIGIAYIYAAKKHMDFIDILFMNEYGFAVGNFGLPIAIVMFLGMILLYIRAFKGEILPLLLIVIYTIFYLPFSMQAATFEDPHAFLFYWSRYYFSVLMVVHVLALGFVFKRIYELTTLYIYNKILHKSFISVLVIVLFSLSMNHKLYSIVVKESHLKGTYKLYPWVSGHVGQKGIYILSEDGVIYKQNARPDGLEKIEYLIGRMFSLHKVPEKGHAVTTSDILYEDIPYNLPRTSADYILCVGQKECHLNNEKLTAIDTLKIPLEWREHFGLDKNASTIHHHDITKSVVQYRTLYATLYRIDQKVVEGKKISFKKGKKISTQMLGEGWSFINNRSSAFAASGVGVITLPKMKKIEGKVHTLKLRYAVINASDDNSKVLTITHDGYVLQSTQVTSHLTQDTEIVIPDSMLTGKAQDINLKIEAKPKGQIMLRSITMNLKGER